MNSFPLNINLSFKQLLDVVKQLSPSEKLKLNDVLWDEHMEVPVEHQKLVLERKQKTKEKPERMLDWEKAAKTLKG